MRVLLTGGAGYLGCRLTAHLLAEGHDVAVVDRMDHGADGLLGLADHPGLTVVPIDIRTFARQPGRYDAVVHLAALVGPICETRPEKARADNVEAAPPLLDMADRMLFFSTCSNYGVHIGGEATEETPLNPLSVYAETKAEAERLVLDAGGCAFRLGTLCGVSPRMRFDLLVNEIALNLSHGRETTIFAPDASRPFLHLRDACTAISAMLNDFRPGVWNVTGANASKRDLIEMARRIDPAARFHVKEGVDDPRDYRVSSAKFQAAYGWAPEHSIEAAMREVAGIASGMRDPWGKAWRNA